jgi:sugar lactone lactonase YvrE
MLWLVALFIILQPGIFSKKIKLENILLRAYLFIFIAYILQGPIIKEGFQTTTYVVSTLAGQNSGFVDAPSGPGSSASFNVPTGVAVGTSGNVIVADTFNNRIRMVTPEGVVSTLAGSGSNTFADGTGANASFNIPFGVAIDKNGNVFVADTGNSLIRKVTPGGVVTTLAGSGSQGFADGNGTSASFYTPCGVAIDKNGNVIVADTYNHRIRMVTPEGVVSTLAGSGSDTFADGTGANASFNSPRGVAVDANNNIIVADTLNSCIRIVTPVGAVTTLAGSRAPAFADGTGAAASFRHPFGVAVDANGNVIVADAGNSRIRKVTPGGVVSTIAGRGLSVGSMTAGGAFANGTGADALFFNPTGVAINANGNIIVADKDNNRIRIINMSVVNNPPTPAPVVAPPATPLVIPAPKSNISTELIIAVIGIGGISMIGISLYLNAVLSPST